MKAAGCTDVGLVRENNEDAFGIWEQEGLLIVADGMGGHEAGEVASRQAVDVIRRELTKHETDGSPRERLRRAVDTANEEIRRDSQARRNDMGTTATAAWLLDDRLYLAQVGDSRAYLLRGGELIQLTHDHSVVNELVTAGVLSPESAAAHPARNMLTRALGQEDPLEIDVLTRVVEPTDILLLCSDGLTTMVTDEEIRQHLANGSGLRETAERLIALANERGGADNTTVVLARVTGRKPATRSRRRWLLPAIPAAVLALLALGAHAFASRTYYLGPHGGQVALYRGFPVTVGSRRLARVVHTTDVSLDSLEAPYADRIRRGMFIAGPAEARKLLDRIARPSRPDET